MRRTGFTLLEVLVALAVLGFLLVGLSEGVRFGARAFGMQARAVARQSDMDSTMRALRRLIAQADPGDANDSATFVGTAHTLSFDSALPEAASFVGGRRATIALGVDSGDRLVLRAAQKMHAERLGPPLPPMQTVLLSGVDHVDFAYYRAVGRKPGWTESWTDDSPPALVRMHLGFVKGDKRAWPDLIAMTRMARDDD
jgi:general secretion pathway protein J